MDSVSASPDNDTPKAAEHEQKSRSLLRERYLRSVKAFYDNPVEFKMHERTSVSAIFRATDIEMENLQVSQLQTPIGIVPEALLRSSDVLCFTVQLTHENSGSQT